MDADLQDPPEVIAQMLARWREGYQVVYGKRIARAGETRFKLLTAGLFYRLVNRLSRDPIPANTGDFRLMDRQVVDALLRLPERDRYLRGMISWVGFRQVAVPYRRKARLAGTPTILSRNAAVGGGRSLFLFRWRPCGSRSGPAFS